MKVVLDTNILLVSVSPKSPYRWIFDAFLSEKFTMCVTTDILTKYEEIIGREMKPELASLILQLIENAVNTEFITRYFEWHLIQADVDDNKFVDCAVAANADFIVTQDKHFNILSSISFPCVRAINVDTFKSILLSENQ
jgi:putative PIN family toxin of toxin-antitoxin system